MKEKRIGLIIGSLRTGSFSKAVGNALIALAHPSLKLEIIDISALSIYNQDLDSPEATPKSWQDFRDALQPLDGFIFITPEYNRSVPAVLKNALDIASRPYGQSMWNGKPGAVISASPGGLGGFGANHHLRQTLTFLNVPLLQQPEMYLANIAAALEEGASGFNERTTKLLAEFLEAYAAWVSRF